MAWRKGESGNPGGRKRRDRELEALVAKVSRSPKGQKHKTLERIAKIAHHSDDEKAAIAACKVLLEYEFGKPRQRLEHSGPGGDSITVRFVKAKG